MTACELEHMLKEIQHTQLQAEAKAQTRKRKRMTENKNRKTTRLFAHEMDGRVVRLFIKEVCT